MKQWKLRISLLIHQDIRRKSDGMWTRTDQMTEVLWDNVFNDKICKRTNRYVMNMKEWIRSSIIKWMTLSTCLKIHSFSKLEIIYLFGWRAANFTRLKVNCLKWKTTNFLFKLQVHFLLLSVIYFYYILYIYYYLLYIFYYRLSDQSSLTHNNTWSKD